MNIEDLTIGFVGLGLIGGSIAKTIRRVFPQTVIHGFDIDKESGRQAEQEGVLTHFYEELDEEFANCDIIFLCAPVSVNIEYLTKLKPIISDHCLITDVGSVKEPMQKAVAELGMEGHFIGGHPMVGSEKSGFANSNDHLLENAYYFLTPTYHTQFQLTTMFSSYIQKLGALAVNLPPETHDFITASISHIPHIVAAELVHLVRRVDKDNGMLKQLAAGGFKDITRIASSSPIMWESICFNNSENIKKILETMIDDLKEVINQIDSGNREYIESYFKLAGDYRNSVPDHAVGLFEKIYRIHVDIPDEPGTIASIASQLAYHNINIKNIGITHNREFEEGVLEVILYDAESCDEAVRILTDRNYTVHIR
ncbi:MAG: prephenate dehydrogenase [Lachnospiraceae bacterium]|nr:prephenate dehydrogenase [Lachnospiraceae bacterium]